MTIYLVFLTLEYKNSGLVYVDLFIKISTEKSSLYIHLEELWIRMDK